MQRAKIVATIGPASSERSVIRGLIEAGMDVARLNFSHGSYDQHRAVFETIRDEAAQAKRAVAILQDLQGPKIRVRTFADGRATLKTGAHFRLVTEPVVGDERQASITYPTLYQDVRPGEDILLDDGLLHLRVREVGDGWVDTEVLVGGVLKDKKGVNLPNTRITIPSLTAKDREDLEFGTALGVDFVALSFVRSSLDIHQLRAYLPENGPDIIAKIEKPQAVAALPEIVAAADGIMVARGDLGVEMPPEQVPMIQKRALDLANELGKVSITATQMLESMTVNPRPTRAEASDVANAIYDGTDAVMLSGETAAGAYPIESVAMMARIIDQAERTPYFRAPTSHRPALRSQAESIARATTAAAAALDVRVIACFTMTGRTPRLIKAYRPSQTVLAFTPSRATYHKLALQRGVTPVLTELRGDTDGLIDLVVDELRSDGLASPGEHVVIVMGVPAGTDTPANLIKYHQIPH
ncbi:MAG: pyruvate kinase [Myxococcales bacterium]|nr:pyruvate kinase [Myxococcales bacterium]MCB9520705.1 pyruvate kinase [Myxococcales bacterium]MCB9532109.1 pyruvate kinase [Myxococcales bacterium]